jgi:hypothetical protein
MPNNAAEALKSCRSRHCSMTCATEISVLDDDIAPRASAVREPPSDTAGHVKRRQRRESIWISAITLAPAIATTTDLGTGIGNGTGIAVNGIGRGSGTADTIGQGNLKLLTGARMAGRCKTVSASSMEGNLIVRRNNSIRSSRGIRCRCERQAVRRRMKERPVCRWGSRRSRLNSLQF